MRRWAVAMAIIAGGCAFAVPAAHAQIDLGKSYDTSLPIEITADTLEVEQENQIAIFTGNVDAVQGKLNLRADLLKVHYRANDEGANSISKIEAENNVLLSSPTETAQGDRGVYDVDSEKVHLFGSVVLTRGENVIKGDRMELNLATGKSKVESAVAATDGQQRVKALFVPKKKPAAQ
jgi:lipopolysaccharide export system protein LptA